MKTPKKVMVAQSLRRLIAILAEETTDEDTVIIKTKSDNVYVIEIN